MTGLTLVGAPRPVKLEAIPAPLRERLPPDYLGLLSKWGPGILCGIYELPDPTETNGRFAWLQNRLRVQGLARRRAGAWPQLTEEDVLASIILAVDRSGVALATTEPNKRVVALHPGGYVQDVASIEKLTALLVKDKALDWGRAASDWKRYANTDGRGIPAIYVTDPPTARSELRDALLGGDQDAADEALQRVLATEVAACVLVELAGTYAGPEGAAIPRELRASFVDELLRLAKRRIPKVGDELPMRAIRTVLTASELPKPMLDKLLDNTLVRPPEGIFVGTFDATEAALLAELAARPDDGGTRLVYADHLEQQGDVARAQAVRAAAFEPLADASARGFIARSNRPPVDEPLTLRLFAERWRSEDPDTPIDTLVARHEALHPTQRQGYALLLDEMSWATSPAGLHLVREMPEAWPYLVLALRGGKRQQILSLLDDQQLPEIAPYLMSLLRRPPTERVYDEEMYRIAELYAGLVDVSDAIVDEFLPRFETHVGQARTVAFALLQGRSDDERVFLGYLENFAAAHPYSERALKDRKKDPRILPALLAQFDVEEKRSLADGKHLRYTFAYGVLAKMLRRLGNVRGKEAAKRFKATEKWGQGWSRDDDM